MDNNKYMPPLPPKVCIQVFLSNKVHNSRMVKVVKSEIKLGFPFMVAEVLYKL